MPSYIPTTWIAKVSEFTAAAMNKLELAVKALADNSIEKSVTQPQNPTLGMIWVQSGAAPDTQAPTAPVQAALSATSSAVTVTWAPSTDNVSVQGYDVWRLISATWTKVNPQLVTGTTFTEFGLAPNTSYGPYLVRARDFAGNISGDSNQRGPITTAVAGDTTAPTTPTGLTATAGNGQVTLTCNPSTDAVGVVGYNWWTNNANPQSSSGTTKVITGLTNGVTYSFSVSAYDAVPNESGKSATVSAAPTAGGDVTPPSAPGTLTVTPGNGQLNLSWGAATDLVGVHHYRLFLDNVYQVDVAGTSYVLAGLSNGTSYAVKLTAVDAAGNEGPANTPVSGTPFGTSGAVFTDDFSRADVATSTVGSTALGGGWNLVSGAWAIVSGQLKVNSNATTAQLLNSNVLTTNDQFIEFVYAGGAPAAGEIHLQLRCDSTAQNWLAARFIPNTTGGGSAVIMERCVAGSLTNLGTTVTLGALMTAGDLMRFEVDGPAMTAKLNGAVVNTASTTSVPTGTVAGVRAKTALNLVVDSERHGDL